MTDAECKIGELIREIPKKVNNNPSGNNQYRGQISTHVDSTKPKSAVLKENGISQRQAEHFQMMIHLLIQSDSELIHHDSRRFKAESEGIKRNQRESYRNQKRRLQGEIQRTEPELDAQRMFSGPVRRESSADILILITSNS